MTIKGGKYLRHGQRFKDKISRGFSDATQVQSIKHRVVAETLVRKKNAYIVALTTQLKMPVTEDPMAKEIEATETKKEEMLHLIVEET